jgi:hypothetical protein
MTSSSADDELDKPIDISEFADTNYTTPAQKSLGEIIHSDANDESLKKYKEKLLGANSDGAAIVDQANPSKVIMKKLSLIADEKVMRSIDLPGISLF